MRAKAVVRFGIGVAGVCSMFLAGCMVGPKYAKPSVAAPPAYKELTPENLKDTDGWKQAQPSDGTLRGKWWEIFGDPGLNSLEEQVSVSNQNIAAAAASFLEARALVRQARAQYYPTLTANPAITNSRPSLGEFGGVSSGSSSSSGFSLKSFTDYSLPFDASWVPDFWGRVRNTFLENATAAQASAADLENVRLTAQAEVAVNYFEIRAQDALKELFDQTVAAYQDSLELTQIQFNAGIASDEAVAQAETQLEATQAQDTDLGIAAGAIRARHGAAGGAAGVHVFAAGGAAAGESAGDSLRGAVGTAGAAARRGFGGTADGAGQRADRPGNNGLLSHGDAQRGGRFVERIAGHVVHLAQPVLVRGTSPGGDAVRCRVAAGDRAAISGVV